MVEQIDLDDRRAGRQDEGLRELLASDHVEHRLERGAAVRVERAAVVRDLDPRQTPQHRVDRARRELAAHQGVGSLRAAARRHLDALLLERGHELRDVGRVVLQVAVHRHDDVGARRLHAGSHRGVLTDVALEQHDAHARIALVDLPQAAARAVGSTRRRRRRPPTGGRTRRASRAADRPARRSSRSRCRSSRRPRYRASRTATRRRARGPTRGLSPVPRVQCACSRPETRQKQPSRHPSAPDAQPAI